MARKKSFNSLVIQCIVNNSVERYTIASVASIFAEFESKEKGGESKVSFGHLFLFFNDRKTRTRSPRAFWSPGESPENLGKCIHPLTENLEDSG